MAQVVLTMRNNNVRPFTVLAWATVLLSPAVSHSETLVNASFDPPAVSGQSYNPTAVTDAPAGTFTFIATFCNQATSQSLGNRLESRTAVLTGGNELLNRTWGSGASSILEFPQTGGYSDLGLDPGECVPVTYEIGLQQRARFEFFVDAWLKQVIYSNGDVDLATSENANDRLIADDFVLASGANVIGGVRWNGVNPVFGIDPGNSFTIRIYEDNGFEPSTDYDNPIYQEVVTASRVPTAFAHPIDGRIYEYRADLTAPFPATPGVKYHLSIANVNGDWGWTRVYDFGNFAQWWSQGSWSILTNDRFSFTLTD